MSGPDAVRARDFRLERKSQTQVDETATADRRAPNSETSSGQ